MDCDSDCSHGDSLWWGLITTAAICLVLTWVSSARLIYNHLRHFTQPSFQRCILRIILMVPIYSTCSFLSLVTSWRNAGAAPFFAVFRSWYEAYVMYVFLTLLIEYKGGIQQMGQTLECLPTETHPRPFCCFRSHPGRGFLANIRVGVLQYVWIKSLTALVGFLLQIVEVAKGLGCGEYLNGCYYCAGLFISRSGFMYLLIADNISIFIALYCLVLFYQVTKVILDPFHPLSKFLCIKAVLFFSFWQEILFALLEQTGVCIQDLSLQNFLICIEMLFASLVFHHAFGYREYVDDSKPRLANETMMNTMKHVVNISDIVTDTVEVFRGKGAPAAGGSVTGEAPLMQSSRAKSSPRDDDATDGHAVIPYGQIE